MTLAHKRNCVCVWGSWLPRGRAAHHQRQCCCTSSAAACGRLKMMILDRHHIKVVDIVCKQKQPRECLSSLPFLFFSFPFIHAAAHDETPQLEMCAVFILHCLCSPSACSSPQPLDRQDCGQSASGATRGHSSDPISDTQPWLQENCKAT